MVEKLILSLGGIGRLKFSGTVATGVTVLGLWFLRDLIVEWWWLMPLKSIGLTLSGVWLIKRVLKKDFDQRWIVWDEVAGVMMAATAWGMAGTVSWKVAVATFLGFRLFDGWKPGVIRKVDRWDSPWGVMLDDVLAGGATMVGLWLWFSLGGN